MTTEETFKWLFEKPYLIKSEKLIKDNRIYNIDVVHLPKAVHQDNNIWLLIFYEKTILHKEVFHANFEESALYRQNFIVNNIEDLLNNEFRGSKLAHYLSGDIFKTEEVLEYFMDFETDGNGIQKAVAKNRIIKMEVDTKCECPECKIECTNGEIIFIDKVVFSCVKCEKVYIKKADGSTFVWFS